MRELGGLPKLTSMKRQARNHTKTDDLMRRLKIPRWGAMGILEALWHLTANEAPRGDIGRFSDERIAAGIDWRGDSGRLISSLVESGWIDADRSYRLLIHDWPDHADEAVKKYLRRNKLDFACLDTSRKSLDMERLPEPEPEVTTETAAVRKTSQIVESPKAPPPALPPQPRNGNGNGKQPNPTEAQIRHVREDLLLYPPAARLRGQPDNKIVCDCIWAVHGDLELLAGILGQMNRDGKKPEKSWAYFPAVIAAEVQKLGGMAQTKGDTT
jgi:hypothetical protein